MCPARRPLRGSGASPAESGRGARVEDLSGGSSAMPSRSRSMVTTPTPMAGREVNDRRLLRGGRIRACLRQLQAASPPFRIDTWWPKNAASTIRVRRS